MPECLKLQESMSSDRVHDGSMMPLRTGYACEVIKFYRDPASGLSCTIGTQGKVIELQKDNGPWARVGIPGIKDAIAIPKQCLQGGSVPWEGQWPMYTNLVIPTVAQPNNSQDDQALLVRSISTFLKAIIKCKAPFITNALISLLGGESGAKVKTVTATMTAGVDQAGLLELLNQDDFTFDSMVHNATFAIDDNYTHGKGGIYFRRYQDLNGEYHAYIGKAQDFRQRYEHYKTKTTGRYHDNLRDHPGSTNSMHALCFLPKKQPLSLFLVCEQVFVSLFETYRPGLLNLDAPVSVERPDYMNHVEAARYMHEAAKAAASASKWPGGTSRTSFGCKFGVNVSSPLSECTFEKALWLRTDATIQLQTKEIVPVAKFRRTTPERLSNIQKTKEGARIGVLSISGYQFEGKTNIVFRSDVSKVDGFDAPRENDSFQLVFEVRLDGKPHQKSWARLPHIGPFMNWDIANSWALRIEWRDPQEHWRSRYCQSVTQQRIPDTQPGTLDTYVNGAGIIHYLFGKSLESRASINNFGFAMVRQVNHNYLQKQITFTDQKSYPNSLNAGRKPNDILVREMKDPKFHLQGINVPFGTMPQTGSEKNRRKKCDTCVLAEGGGEKEKCVEKKGTSYHVCTNCYDVYGRPCCSWTPDINRQDPTKVLITSFVTRTLVIQPSAEGVNLCHDPQLQKLLETIPEDQVMSKEALEQEWEETIEDKMDPLDGEW
jgi:hypothetical protein